MDHEKILENRANLNEPTATIAQEGCYEGCLVFAMRDQHHTFSLDVETVLQCLKVAEQKGSVPELPDQWWTRVSKRYNQV